MNTRALALAAFGLLAVTACKSDDTSTANYEVSDTAVAQPVTFNLTGMT